MISPYVCHQTQQQHHVHAIKHNSNIMSCMQLMDMLPEAIMVIWCNVHSNDDNDDSNDSTTMSMPPDMMTYASDTMMARMMPHWWHHHAHATRHNSDNIPHMQPMNMPPEATTVTWCNVYSNDDNDNSDDSTTVSMPPDATTTISHNTCAPLPRACLSCRDYPDSKHRGAAGCGMIGGHIVT